MDAMTELDKLHSEFEERLGELLADELEGLRGCGCGHTDDVDVYQIEYEYTDYTPIVDTPFPWLLLISVINLGVLASIAALVYRAIQAK
jgi:hypothetical protein